MNNCYAKVIGGIGNQLFIVAAAFAYAKKYDKELIIDTSCWCGGPGSKHINTYTDTIFKNFKHHIGILDGDTPLAIHETQFNYKELPFHSNSVELYGYFQSLKYFEDYKQEFLDLLILPEINKPLLINDGSVAFHIRRGDYLHHPHIFNVCDTNYFNKMFEKFKDYNINVFTDSPDLVLKEFENYDFRLIQSESELMDLTLLSQHANLVCSNSSFSWWSTILGIPKTQILVPNVWLLNQDCSDIYTNDMIKVSL